MRYFSFPSSLTLISLVILGQNVFNPATVLAHEKETKQHQHPASPTHHQTLAIPPGQPIPSVKLVVHPDAIAGWNLEIQVKHFTFAPERMQNPGSPTEGHAHLYVNGQKLTRLYSNWYYLPKLEPGKNTLTVTLNTNSHEELVHNGQTIQASQTIQVPGNPNTHLAP